MRLNSYLLALLVSFAAPAAADSVRDELVREILQRVPEWPQTQVEVPISVYEQFVRDAVLGPTPPKPPEAAWLEQAAWTLRVDDSDEAVVEAALDVVALPGRLARHVKLLPTALAWRDVKIDGKHSFEDTIEKVTDAKDTYGKRIALLGGLDVDFLCRADERQVRARVRATLRKCMPGGGYCLGTGNSVANYIPLDNYLAMLDEGRKFAMPAP